MDDLLATNLVAPRPEALLSHSQLLAKLPFGTKLNRLLFSIPICFILVKAIVGLTILSIWKISRDKKQVLTSNRFQQVPCKTCRFFTNNHYLKCAVHPAVALTKQALNCSDFCLQEFPDSSLPGLSVVSATVFDPQTQSWYCLPNLFADSESVYAAAPFLRPLTPCPSSTL